MQSSIVSENRSELEGSVSWEQVVRDVRTSSQLSQKQFAIFISSSKFDWRNPRTAILVFTCNQQEVAMRMITVP